VGSIYDGSFTAIINRGIRSAKANLSKVPSQPAIPRYNLHMAEQNFFLSISNPLMKWLLRTPLHSLSSGSTMLVTVTGAKTGRQITTPVNYTMDGTGVWVVSSRTRIWWRNLRGSRPCTLRLRGADVSAVADVLETDDDAARGLTRLIELNPSAAGYLGVRPGDEASLRQAGQKWVAIHMHLQ
jgi:deazaflavin-dependent oxidoreductase (nitroreductase family)